MPASDAPIVEASTKGDKLVHRRGFAIAFAAASLLTAMSVGSASAAVVLTTLSAKAGAPGAEVTLGIEMTGRQAGTEAGVLFLVPVDTFSEPTPCEQIDGATALGDMTWHAAQLTFEGGSYPGMASETRFTVPQTPDGAYYLAESWPDPYTRCFSYASFTVDSALPNTATVPSGLPPLPVLGGALLCVALVMARQLPPFRRAR